MKECLTCHRILDDPDDETTRNCGGECLRCMAAAGDPDCIKSLRKIENELSDKRFNVQRSA